MKKRLLLTLALLPFLFAVQNTHSSGPYDGHPGPDGHLYLGFLDFVGCTTGIHGWDAEFLENPIVLPFLSSTHMVSTEGVPVDIYIDNVLTFQVSANLLNNAGLIPFFNGDGAHGFGITGSQMPVRYFDGAAHIVAVFDHTTGAQLDMARVFQCLNR